MFKYVLSRLSITVVVMLSLLHEMQGAFGIEEVSEGLKGNPDGSIETNIQKVVIYLLGFLTLIGIIWIMKGGFQILTAGGDEEKVKGGKKTVLFVLLGLFVVWISWALTVGVIGGLEKNV